MENTYIIKKAHSITQLTYHLVLVVKYRRECIDKELSDFLIENSRRLIEAKGGVMIEGNCDKDHMHILMNLPPDLNLSAFVASLKNTLSRLVRKEFAEYLKDYLWKDAFWSSSFYIGTTGGATLDVIKKYVEDQGRPKRKYVKRNKM